MADDWLIDTSPVQPRGRRAEQAPSEVGDDLLIDDDDFEVQSNQYTHRGDQHSDPFSDQHPARASDQRAVNLDDPFNDDHQDGGRHPGNTRGGSHDDHHSYSENPFEEEMHELDDLDDSGHAVGKNTYQKLNEPRQFDITKLWRHYILRQKGVYASGPLGPREVVVGDPSASNQRYVSNYISTTKYNVATFVPKFLFEQFSKYANLFFLVTALIQQVPNVSPTNRYTTIGTLTVVLLVSATKELAEDWKRWKADRELNNSKVDVLSNTGSFEPSYWSQVKVGDVVRIEQGGALPADVVVLSSSEPEGLCYIETANLDGETNLKIKQARSETQSMRSARELDNLRGARLQSEAPNSSLYTYEATLQLRNTLLPLGVDQMLLRGTSLRNTRWVNGVVVFTGHETKLMRNATATPIKRTAVEYMMDLQIIYLFVILIAMSTMSSLGNVIKLNQWRKAAWYLYLGDTTGLKVFFMDLLTYWILFSNLVPISLFVTIDIIKFWQGYLISSDLEMYDAETDQPAVCRTSSLVEELGQIKYIFSDKTGTLTRNVMEFKACCIDGTVFASDIPEEKKEEYVPFGDQFASSSPQNRLFLTVLATCHTVIPSHSDGKLEYQASSPDEGALVEGAAQLGVPFIARTPSGLTIDTPNGPEDYELLQVCEFNSTRKRMSTVLRCPDGKIRIFTKGADTVIFERLADPSQEDDVTHALEEFASLGLRTLCLAQREISPKEYAEWSVKQEAAATSLEDRSGKLAEAAEEIEQGLELVGVTAIEDKLQEGVPDTIAALQDAGIKIWVLTGDRQETAINIGMSSKLLSEDMSFLIINESDREAVRANISEKLEVIRSVRDKFDLQDSDEAQPVEVDTLALIIDGASLEYALEPELAQDFLQLAIMCKAVICCRVSPLQKSLVVRLAKRNLKDLLLAIGDGANDVSMIQAAHVGVGICGLEGQQAARSADIAIAQFRYLQKLLLVHGMWSYNRLSRAVLYSFYKNIALYFTQFWYVFYNGFSGESIYESWTVTFYNVFSTALPPFAIGVLDQFVSARLLNRYPKLYRLGQTGAFLNTRQFWEWILNGIYHSIIIYWFSSAAYYALNVLSNGLTANHWAWGGAMYTACVFTVLGKAALITNVWNSWTAFAIPGSAVLWILCYPLYTVVGPKLKVGAENLGIASALYPSMVFWALILLVPCACLLRDIGWKYWRRMYVPEYYHYVQEIQKYKINDERPQMVQFQRAIRKVRQIARMRKQRGFAFSAADEGAERVVRAYDRK